MSRTRIVRRVKQLRKAGVSFREIEARLTKTLGMSAPGNGTRAYRLLNKAA